MLGYKVSYQRISGVLIGKKIHHPKNRSLLFGMAGPIKGEQPTSVSLEFITPAYQYEVVHRSGKINRKLILCPEQQQPSLLPE